MAIAHHIIIGAKLMGYNDRQQTLALLAYLDAEEEKETVDTQSLPPRDFAAWCYGRNTFEIETQVD